MVATALGLCAAFAACVPTWRRGRVHGSLETLVCQRVFQTAYSGEEVATGDERRAHIADDRV